MTRLAGSVAAWLVAGALVATTVRGEPTQEWEWTVLQRAALRFYSEVGAGGDVQGATAEWTPEWRLKVSDRIRWRTQLRLRGDAYDRLEPGRPEQQEASGASRRLLFGDQAELDLRELVVEIDTGSGFWRLGKQTIVWGQTDGFKILDVVNPQDLSQFVLEDFGDSRISLWSVLWQRSLGQGTLQLFAIPDATYHREPADDALFSLPLSDRERAVLSMVAQDPQGALAGSATTPITRVPLDRPSGFGSDIELGARWSFDARGWDFSVNALRHHNDLALRAVEASGESQEAGAIVEPVHRRSYLLGGTATRAFGSVVLRSEFAFEQRWFEAEPVAGLPEPNRGLISGEELAAGVGADWRVTSDHTVSAQMLLRRPSADRELLRSSERRDITLAWAWSAPSQRLALRAFALRGLEGNDGLLRLDVDLRWRDRFEFTLGVDVLSGEPGTLFGHFDDRDRIRLGLNTAW